MELVKTKIPSNKKATFTAFMKGRYKSKYTLLKDIDTDEISILFNNGADATEFTLRDTEAEFQDMPGMSNFGISPLTNSPYTDSPYTSPNNPFGPYIDDHSNLNKQYTGGIRTTSSSSILNDIRSKKGL